MFPAVISTSIRGGVFGRHCVFQRCVPGRNPLRHTRTDPLCKGVNRRHVSSWPAKASKSQDSGMVSASQDSRAADDSTLLFLNLINDSAKWVVTLTAGGVLLWYHNVDVSWSLLGSIVTVFLCKVRSDPAIVVIWHKVRCTCAYICWHKVDLRGYADTEEADQSAKAQVCQEN